MDIAQKVRLSLQYGRGIYLVSAIVSIAAAGLCCLNPTIAPTCIFLKLVTIPIIGYLFGTLQGKHTIYFYINLGISRIEYYAIPFAVEFIAFAALVALSIIIGNVIS